MRIVLDTNALIASFSKESPSNSVWRGLIEGKYTLCVSNEILWEYQEMIGKKSTPQIAENVINYLLNSRFVKRINPYYHFDLITTDHDDNKFVDCAIAANATFIVSDDKHFKPLQQITFPHLLIIKLMEFVEILRGLRRGRTETSEQLENIN